MENQQSIMVKNEYGKDMELELIDVITIKNDKYVIVSMPGSDTANAYRAVNRKNGEVEYASIGSGAEFKRVLEAYNAKED
ncbi:MULTISPECIES: DUF1292 domain-containing protein [Clostridium]|uniref:DUF1292 domain-containing protein n=2 Tax=Clostridium novyi TaxID=1542 RepID=A0PY76_CLONN|nr:MULTISPECIES: DUF1292 domain-containing protein [Clostridium]ABK61407.1 conserved hypothetical protein [Clostridium novyi NT]KEH87866.1 hypothetical protein Z966_09715 [Clostridium novyi A str. NCTC 538]KEH91243.1 hypothetical protein Z965_03505 [Clostridium novyi A str. BKT29909]KEH94644.1 hypothetical protein Z963_08715 [Clostridium botulinum C/D str. It1]KEH95703.1 hypothetical protein Z964_03115 [Clostridium novyi A str. GD211209]